MKKQKLEQERERVIYSYTFKGPIRGFSLWSLHVHVGFPFTFQRHT